MKYQNENEFRKANLFGKGDTSSVARYFVAILIMSLIVTFSSFAMKSPLLAVCII